LILVSFLGKNRTEPNLLTPSLGCGVNAGPNAIDSSGQAISKIAFDLATKTNQIALGPAL